MNASSSAKTQLLILVSDLSKSQEKVTVVGATIHPWAMGRAGVEGVLVRKSDEIEDARRKEFWEFQGRNNHIGGDAHLLGLLRHAEPRPRTTSFEGWGALLHPRTALELPASHKGIITWKTSSGS